MGFPIRKSPDQRSLASPRSLSQRATSFIASWRQGIHRALLIRSLPQHAHPHAGPSTNLSQSTPPHESLMQQALIDAQRYNRWRPAYQGRSPILFTQTNPDSPVKTARPHSVSTFLRYQAKPANRVFHGEVGQGRSFHSTTRKTLTTHANLYSLSDLNRLETENHQPPASKAHNRKPLWRLSDSNRLGTESHQPPAGKARNRKPLWRLSDSNR